MLSGKARARLVSVDPAAALAMPGVVDFLSHTDVPASKRWGMGQEEVFASEEVSEILPSSDVIGWGSLSHDGIRQEEVFA